jgi:hypothetical protein
MKDVDSRLVGVLGTLIFHLVAAIIFMSFKLNSISPVSNDQFSVEFFPEEIILPEEEPKETPSTIEQILADDENMLNLARNLANNGDVTIDPQDYIDMVKEEMIENGLLDENNFIDEWKNRVLDVEDENIVADLTNDEPSESQIMEANYQGPTRIYYDLERRNHTYLPIPIYKCQGSGKITLSIEVSQQGNVTNAKVMANESTTSDQCLVETAVNTAMISRFNPDVNAPRIQNGTLTYLFVAQ